MPTVMREFSSWIDFVETANGNNRAWSLRSSRSKEHRDGWYGTIDFNTAVDMAIKTGWPEGRQLLADSYAIVAPRPEPVISEAFSVAGMYPNIPIYLAGSPECMVDRFASNIAVNPIVRIDYTNGGISTVSAKSLMLRGAAVLSLCNQLERRGYSIEICLAAHTVSSDHSFDTRITVKRAGEPIDLDRLAFSLAHPSTHRRLRFSLLEQHLELERYFSHNYGSTQQSPPVQTSQKNVIYIPGPSGNVNETPQSARLAVAIAAKDFLQQNNLNGVGELLSDKEMIW